MAATQFIEAVTTPSGDVLALSTDGVLWQRLPHSGMVFQHLPASQRPSHRWEKLPPPHGVKVDRLLPGPHGLAFILGTDGVLYERRLDTTNMTRQASLWFAIEGP